MLNKFISCILILCITACQTGKKAETVTPVKKDFPAEKYERATVKYWELDGCTYMLELENGKKLNPGKLDSSYASDGLKVWIKYKQVDRVNICMSGTTVDIIDIQKRLE